jgi:hypothetical protein
MESKQINPLGIQLGKPRILSTYIPEERKGFEFSQNRETDSETQVYLKPSDIIIGKPRICKTVAGVEGHERLPRPFFNLRHTLKVWDKFNTDLYRCICLAKESVDINNYEYEI